MKITKLYPKENLGYVDQHLLEAKFSWQSPLLNKDISGQRIHKARQNLHKLSEVAQLSKLQHHQEGLTKRLAADSKQVHDVLMPPNHLDKGIFTVCKTRVARDICCRYRQKCVPFLGVNNSELLHFVTTWRPLVDHLVITSRPLALGNHLVTISG